jgi:hypothetical protein
MAQRGKAEVRMLRTSEQLKTNLKQNYSEKLIKFAISQQNAQFKKNSFSKQDSLKTLQNQSLQTYSAT